MKRVIFDTNIYGLIAVDKERRALREAFHSSAWIVYGSPVVRKELRKTPKGRIDGINLRPRLLGLYHEITKNKEVSVDQRERGIADSYHRVYKDMGGKTTRSKLDNDFLIVASASRHNLDIVVSDDSSTMMQDIALKVYSAVNAALNIKKPRFVRYEELKRRIRK